MWYTAAGRAEIRQEKIGKPGPGDVSVRALHGALSRGTEALVFGGRVPASEHDRMRSPHMGGVSKWSVLTDEDLSTTMPEVFDTPPEIVGGFMAQEAKQALLKWNPLVFGVILERGLIVAGPLETVRTRKPASGPEKKLMRRMMRFLRRALFDRFGRS